MLTATYPWWVTGIPHDDPASAGIRRREFLRSAGLIGVGAGIAGCSSRSGDASGTAGSSRSTGPSAPSATATASSAALPSTEKWYPSKRDVAPWVKTAAVRMVEAVAVWGSDGDGSAAGARQRLEQAGYDPALADDLEPLLGNAQAAAAQVAVAQYGGILTDSASVLIVVDQWTLDDLGEVRAGGTTVDVRLEADEPQWAVTDVRPARWDVDEGDLSRVARRLLENDRVAFPFAAIGDIRSGAVDDSVLLALGLLSETYRLDVSVLRSGHPLRVFGTDRISNHTEGRAVDIWAIDGRPIIELGAGPVVTNLMRDASDVGAYQVGGPADLDGGDPVYFADDTHQDHIHLGFPA